SMIGPRDIGSFYMLKLTYKIRPVERELPTAEEFKEMIEIEKIDRVVKMVGETPTAEYHSLARRLWETTDGERVVAALLERLLVTPVAPEPPRPEPRERGVREERDGRGGRRERGGRRGGRDMGGARETREIRETAATTEGGQASEAAPT